MDKCQIRLLIIYDFKSDLTTPNCHARILNAFPDSCLSISTVKYWFRRFKEGNFNLEDNDRCGRPSTAATDGNRETVRELVQNDNRITYSTLSAELGIGNSAVQTILQELGLTKRICKFVPHELTQCQKDKRVEVANFILNKFNSGESGHVYNIVTGDETILRQYDPLSKQQSAVWCFEGEDPPAQVKASQWVKRCMVCIFFS